MQNQGLSCAGCGFITDRVSQNAYSGDLHFDDITVLIVDGGAAPGDGD